MIEKNIERQTAQTIVSVRAMVDDSSVMNVEGLHVYSPHATEYPPLGRCKCSWWILDLASTVVGITNCLDMVMLHGYMP